MDRKIRLLIHGRTPPSNGPITTDTDFEAVLAAAIEQAFEAGIDIRGAWEFDLGGSVHDWKVEVVELSREFDEDE